MPNKQRNRGIRPPKCDKEGRFPVPNTGKCGIGHRLINQCCRPCQKCKPGERYMIKLNSCLCTICTPGTYSNNHVGTKKCLTARDCTAEHRYTKVNSTNVNTAECGKCWDGYVPFHGNPYFACERQKTSTKQINTVTLAAHIKELEKVTPAVYNKEWYNTTQAFDSSSGKTGVNLPYQASSLESSNASITLSAISISLVIAFIAVFVYILKKWNKREHSASSLPATLSQLEVQNTESAAGSEAIEMPDLSSGQSDNTEHELSYCEEGSTSKLNKAVPFFTNTNEPLPPYTVTDANWSGATTDDEASGNDLNVSLPSEILQDTDCNHPQNIMSYDPQDVTEEVELHPQSLNLLAENQPLLSNETEAHEDPIDETCVKTQIDNEPSQNESAANNIDDVFENSFEYRQKNAIAMRQDQRRKRRSSSYSEREPGEPERKDKTKN